MFCFNPYKDLTSDFDLKTVSRNSLYDITSSFDSFEALLSDDSGKDDHFEVPMPSPILIEAKIKVATSRRKRDDKFVQLYRRSNNFEPIDVEIRTHLENLGK